MLNRSSFSWDRIHIFLNFSAFYYLGACLLHPYKLAKSLLNAASRLYPSQSKQQTTLSWEAINRNAQHHKSSWATRLQPSESTIVLVLSSDHDRGFHKPKCFSGRLLDKSYHYVLCYTSWGPFLSEDTWPWPGWIRHAFIKDDLGWCTSIRNRPAIVMVDVERNDLISFFSAEEAKHMRVAQDSKTVARIPPALTLR